MPLMSEMLETERPRERLWRHGSSSLKISELLAILLRTGVTGKSALCLGDELLHRYKSLDCLCRADVQELAQIHGIGTTKAIQLKAAFELGARLSKSQVLDLPIDTPEAVSELLGDEMRSLRVESLRVLAVNSRFHLIAIEEMSRGTVDETIAHPRDILRVALLHRAFGLLVVHNHPSGDPSPSNADLQFTLKLKQAGDLMQVPIIDHVILGTEGFAHAPYYSFKEAGYL